jgi:hypothetical protein
MKSHEASVQVFLADSIFRSGAYDPTNVFNKTHSVEASVT